ncbi:MULTISPECIES: hypothetical protein [Arthrobacter]|uniref:hypothetical protein n=1 Tax=Arthrobacter TaxID=1663 RepID=UPI001D146852|nr:MULTISPECIES: hypothetical protein [Arthrobacter]MCC3280931.1 hypothetical protein [Arthrobacter caoxuetaonis]MCC9192905.1 hypothetical protein [Arthrobacter sp. zg-Y916]
MSGTFWETQLQEDEESREGQPRKPLWAWAVTALDLLVVAAAAPVVILVAVPFFAVFYVYLAQVLVWASPVLLGANAVLFVWAFRRKYAGMTGLAILSVLFVLLSVLLVILWGAPFTVFGMTF